MGCCWVVSRLTEGAEQGIPAGAAGGQGISGRGWGKMVALTSWAPAMGVTPQPWATRVKIGLFISGREAARSKIWAGGGIQGEAWSCELESQEEGGTGTWESPGTVFPSGYRIQVELAGRELSLPGATAQHWSHWPAVAAGVREELGVGDAVWRVQMTDLDLLSRRNLEAGRGFQWSNELIYNFASQAIGYDSYFSWEMSIICVRKWYKFIVQPTDSFCLGVWHLFLKLRRFLKYSVVSCSVLVHPSLHFPNADGLIHHGRSVLWCCFSALSTFSTFPCFPTFCASLGNKA